MERGNGKGEGKGIEKRRGREGEREAKGRRKRGMRSKEEVENSIQQTCMHFTNYSIAIHTCACRF